MVGASRPQIGTKAALASPSRSRCGKAFQNQVQTASPSQKDSSLALWFKVAIPGDHQKGVLLAALRWNRRDRSQHFSESHLSLLLLGQAKRLSRRNESYR